MITEPGVFDIDEASYHADPVEGGSLSSSEARLILHSPAHFRWRRLNGEEKTDRFDWGHAVHGLVLGVGREVAVVDAHDWRTKDARAAKAEAHAAGRVPLLAHDWERAQAMAAKVYEHPLAAALLDRDRGLPERTLVWRDPATGVMLRALIDYLPHRVEGRRFIVVDFKSSRDAETRAFGRSAAAYGYHQQAAFYLDGVRNLLEVDDPAIVFVVQESEPPHLVNVVELDPYAITIGRERNRRAIDLYAQCVATDTWPGYPEDVQLVTLPRWVEIAHEEEFSA